MRVVYDTSSSQSMHESGNAKRCRTEQYIVLWSNRSGWHFVNNPLNLTSIKEKKTEVDPGTLPQLRWSSMWQGYLICFSKGTKKINRHTCHSKKSHSSLGHLKTFNLKTSRTLKSSWKQEIEQVQMQAPTSRCCADELLKFSVIPRLDQQKCNA